MKKDIYSLHVLSMCTDKDQFHSGQQIGLYCNYKLP